MQAPKRRCAAARLRTPSATSPGRHGKTGDREDITHTWQHTGLSLLPPSPSFCLKVLGRPPAPATHDKSDEKTASRNAAHQALQAAETRQGPKIAPATESRVLGLEIATHRLRSTSRPRLLQAHNPDVTEKQPPHKAMAPTHSSPVQTRCGWAAVRTVPPLGGRSQSWSQQVGTLPGQRVGASLG